MKLIKVDAPDYMAELKKDKKALENAMDWLPVKRDLTSEQQTAIRQIAGWCSGKASDIAKEAGALR